MRTLVRSVLFAAAVALVGCTDSSPGRNGGSSATPPETDSPRPPRPRAPAARGVELIDVTYAGLHAAIEQNRGNVVVVDVWSTTCAPCLKKFPHMVALHDKHAQEGLVLITVTIDAKEDREKALKKLQDFKSTAVNFLLADTEENEKKWEDQYPAQQLPVLLVYNRKGERVVTDFGKLKEPEIDTLVGKLLAEK